MNDWEKWRERVRDIRAGKHDMMMLMMMMHCFEFLFGKKIILIQKRICFEIIQNGDKSNWPEQRSVIIFLVDEKCKTCEI